MLNFFPCVYLVSHWFKHERRVSCAYRWPCSYLRRSPAFDQPTRLSLAEVTGHVVARSFRTQVISYRFGHFVPFWSFRTHFHFQFGHFVTSLVISYPVWSFRTYFYNFLEKRFCHFVPIFYCFVPKLFRTRSHFVPILVISYPGHFVPTSKLGTN